MIAALFVQTGGVYFGLDGVDPWDEPRDARKYRGPHSVVAHPPCNRWIRLGANNYLRWGKEHNRPGNDGGCFASALRSVREFGGVLEHPANSFAWPTFGLTAPSHSGWLRTDSREWVCQVSQSMYGHAAQKRTWLFYCGNLEPTPMRWGAKRGSHQVGFWDQRGKSRNKPRLTKALASSTPVEFRDALVELAVRARLEVE